MRCPTLDLTQLANPDSLTPLQRDIAALVRQGSFRHEIATELGLATTAVAAEIQAIYFALGIGDLLSLAFYAHHHDLKSLSQPVQTFTND